MEHRRSLAQESRRRLVSFQLRTVTGFVVAFDAKALEALVARLLANDE